MLYHSLQSSILNATSSQLFFDGCQENNNLDLGNVRNHQLKQMSQVEDRWGTRHHKITHLRGDVTVHTIKGKPPLALEINLIFH